MESGLGQGRGVFLMLGRTDRKIQIEMRLKKFLVDDALWVLGVNFVADGRILSLL